MVAEPAWGSFAVAVLAVTAVLVVLARLSAGLVHGRDGEPGPGGGSPGPDGEQRADSHSIPAPGRGDAGEGDGTPTAGATEAPAADTAPGDGEDRVVGQAEPLSPGVLLVNVAVTQGTLAGVLGVAAWLAGVPPSALGLGPSALGAGAVAAGVGLGGLLYGVDEGFSLLAERVGLLPDETLRESMTPAGPLGWAVLLGFVLPVVACFEELLFRGALVGALSVGFGVSPWLLAAASSLLFGLAHGAQGPAGMVVTGALGFGLAAAFVLTESLLVVVVAHYLVNALEFGVREGLGWSPGS